MPYAFRAVVLALSLLFLPVSGAAPAPGDSLTVGRLLGGLKGVVAQLEESAASLLEQGNHHAAQQQMLLAGTIQAAIARIEKPMPSPFRRPTTLSRSPRRTPSLIWKGCSRT